METTTRRIGSEWAREGRSLRRLLTVVGMHIAGEREEQTRSVTHPSWWDAVFGDEVVRVATAAETLPQTMVQGTLWERRPEGRASIASRSLAADRSPDMEDRAASPRTRSGVMAISKYLRISRSLRGGRGEGTGWVLPHRRMSWTAAVVRGRAPRCELERSLLTASRGFWGRRCPAA